VVLGRLETDDETVVQQQHGPSGKPGLRRVKADRALLATERCVRKEGGRRGSGRGRACFVVCYVDVETDVIPVAKYDLGTV